MLAVELLIVLFLIVANGLLAMSEIALVSSRRTRLETLAQSGHPGARQALRLIADPSRLLSTVQIGITLTGIVAGAYGGATLAHRLGTWLDRFDIIAPNGDAIAIIPVVATITYLSLLGELVPKRIAMTNPEPIASAVALAMYVLSRAAAPAVWLLRSSTEGMLRVLGFSGARMSTVTEEEVRSLIAEGTRSGVFEPQEREMIEGVFRLADRPARAIMTPRADIEWVDLNADDTTLQEAFANCRFSRLLVCDGSVDHAVGIVQMRDVIPVLLEHQPMDLKTLMRPALFVPDRTAILKLLDMFKDDKTHLAIVVDEYGTTEGLVTLTDLLESIAGEIPEPGEDEDELLVERDDGSWLADGMIPIDEFEDMTGLRGLRNVGNFHTLAGFVLHCLGHLPKAGDKFTHDGSCFEVVDMDGRRIDKVLVTPGLDRLRTDELTDGF